MADTTVRILADGIGALFSLLGVGWMARIFNLFLTIAAAIWLYKLVFRSGNRKTRRRRKRGKSSRHSNWHSDDWLVRAQERQNRIYEYTDPVKSNEKIWSPTGWYFDEEKGEWVAPDYLKKEASKKWEWDEKKRIWIDKTKQN